MAVSSSTYSQPGLSISSRSLELWHTREPTTLRNGDSSIGSSVGGTSSGTGKGRTRLTKSVDIFALGCLYYYTITGGEHPYGDRYEREANIFKDAKSLEWLEQLGEEGFEAVDIINKMLNQDPKLR